MDPNLFHLDWDRLFEVITTVGVLAVILERSLALMFENRYFMERTKAMNIKEFIAFVGAVVICMVWDFDAVSMIVLQDKTRMFGKIVTAGVIAGGTKGSVKLFRDIMGIRSSSMDAVLKSKEDEGKR